MTLSLRRTRRWFLVTVGLISSVSFGASTTSADSATSDTEGPVIHDFEINESEFKPGEIMEIEATVTDETDIERLYFRFEHEDGGGAVYDAYRDFNPPVGDGTYTITYEWPDDTPGGTYEATWIFARDSIGNTNTQTDEFPLEKRQIEIISDKDDTEGPVIHDFEFSDDSFEPGEILEIDVEVTDQTGIERLYFRFEHEDGGGAVYDAYRDFDPSVGDGTYTITYEWPDDTPGGTYEATWIFARDSIGNNNTQTDEFPLDERQLDIISEKDDTEGPVIHDFEFSADSFEPGEIMEIDVEVTDETGIERLYFRFEHEDGGGAVFDAYRDFNPPVGDGTYTITYEWPNNTPQGIYEATWIFARDSIGNTNTQTDDFPLGERQLEIISDSDDVPIEVDIGVEGEGTTNPEPNIHTYPEGEHVTIKAIPDTGWKFAGWSGDIEDENQEIGITVEEDLEIIAEFDRQEYDLSIEKEGEGNTNPDEGQHTYEFGEEVTVKATPDDGWEFSGWAGDIEVEDDEIELAIEEEMEVIADFERKEYELTIEIEGEGSTSITEGVHTFEFEEEVELEATPETGWEFVGWTGDVESEETLITVAIEEDMEVVANFSQEETPTPTPTPTEPTPTPTPTPPDSTPTPTPGDPTPTPTDDDDSIPGPGIVGTVASLAGAGCVLKWWSDKQDNEHD